MSEEAAFLAALKANPADDTTRLVYADWLDEHGEEQKAEYLRLVTRIPCRNDAVEIASAEAIQANELGATIPTVWKEEAAGRFDLVLLDFTDKVRAIKWIRDVFDVCLASAKAIVEGASNRLLIHVSLDSATSHRNRLLDAGMRLIVIPCECAKAHDAVLFQVLAECTPFCGGFDPEQWGLDPKRDKDALAVLARLVAEAMGIKEDDALSRVRATAFTRSDRYSARCFIVAEDLSLSDAKALVARCGPFTALNHRFGVDCYISGRVIPES